MTSPKQRLQPVRFMLQAAIAFGVATTAQAASPACGSVDECRAQLDAAMAQLTELSRGALADFSTAVKDERGYVTGMSRFDASVYCAKNWGHLPTPREFARFGVSRGAKGIRETAHPKLTAESSVLKAEISKMEAAGYEAIYHYTWSSGQIDPKQFVDFYYNKKGYRMPVDKVDAGRFNYWSTSSEVYRPDVSFTFSAEDGTITDGVRSNLVYSVVCVPGR